MHRGEGARLVGDVPEPERDGHAVERVVGERQRLGVALGVVDVADDARVDQTLAPGAEHRRVDVGEQHLPAAADAARELPGQIPRAARDVEDALPRAHARLLDREPLPDPVDAERHQVVHDVVARRDRVEHLADQRGLLAGADGAIAEVRGGPVGGVARLPGGGRRRGAAGPVRTRSARPRPSRRRPPRRGPARSRVADTAPPRAVHLPGEARGDTRAEPRDDGGTGDHRLAGDARGGARRHPGRARRDVGRLAAELRIGGAPSDLAHDAAGRRAADPADGPARGLPRGLAGHQAGDRSQDHARFSPRRT